MPITQIKYQLLNRKKKRWSQNPPYRNTLNRRQYKCLKDDRENDTKGDGPA